MESSDHPEYVQIYFLISAQLYRKSSKRHSKKAKIAFFLLLLLQYSGITKIYSKIFLDVGIESNKNKNWDEGYLYYPFLHFTTVSYRYSPSQFLCLLFFHLYMYFRIKFFVTIPQVAYTIYTTVSRNLKVDSSCAFSVTKI